ncbi:hypothetical protein VI817_002644 [Penicillium citrinum]|nr:hypothetical protein VI817_002644 [Penicillium citrinum]
MSEIEATEPEATVTLLLLGDAGCGKSTFLSRLKNGRRPSPSQPGTTVESAPEPLRDSDQPFIYDIRFSKKKFTLELYDTASPNQHWTSLHPDVVVIAFDISNRGTLDGLKAAVYIIERANCISKKWRNDITRYFQHGHGERIPVMLLGLKRDLRTEGEGIIYPQEVGAYQTKQMATYRIAQELRCDRYAECSAVTGELLAETFEDLARMAGMTTTSKGGQTAGGCLIL